MHLLPSEKRNLIIKESRNGKGIFGRKSFSPQEIVFEVTGIFISGDEGDVIDDQTRDNTYRYDRDRYISPAGRIGDFLNHSCAPNAKVSKDKKKLFIEAIKSIPKGKEITIDYSTIIASDDSWTMKCNCGSKKCRGKIGKFKSLPKEIKERYSKATIVPLYILEI